MSKLWTTPVVHRHAIEFGAFWVAHIPTSVIIITTTRIFGVMDIY